MDAKVKGSSPSFKIHRGSAGSTQKGGTGPFGVAKTFACREPCLDSFQVVVGLREDNRRVSSRSALGNLRHASYLMGSGIIYYEIEKREKYKDSDERADSDLAIVKTRRYHFDDESFIYPFHSVRFDPDCPYELPVKSLLALKRRDPSKKKDSTPQESSPSRKASPIPQYSPLSPMI
ncbi:hypothetical protein PIB30_089277 [Stylosanthes scabra]|uniref:Uncharacterized protein n=1 Tax=Stylosanthes scabra TaxID=79078 RepID=A0ABU6SUW2_9FABA|nr:hypothetical protein [Stylosanthes scabra]